MLCRSLLSLGFAAISLARSIPHKIARQEPSTTASAPNVQSTACGDIINAVDKEGYQLFAASDAYECLTSVPFNSAVASRFIAYWNETLEFQTTLAYLKSPPEGYQQPPVDVASELTKIQQRVDAGAYQNQYDFEADIQLLNYALKDGHVALNAGILSAFSFGSPWEITSASIDGKQTPRIYITDDLLPEKASQPWSPSPVVTINGTEVNEFVRTYAALNSWGYLEPHAEWNDLMSHPTLDIQGGLTTFSGSGTFYPGDDLIFTFENGTSLDTLWIAIYNEPANATGPLTTGGDFYNYFVLGLLPASFVPIASPPEDDGSGSDSAESTPGNWSEASYGAFPENPDIVQDSLGVFSTGIVTGYFFKDISTGVLSLPSFDPIPESIGDWSFTVASFIANISNAGVDKVVIDLQRNSGGTPLLAYTTFKNFFPDLTPFAGSRRRSFELANVLGSATTEWWNSLDENDDANRLTKFESAANEWVVTDRLNAATGNNFSSWSEYQGPIKAEGDEFSLIERYDLANPTFDTAAFDEWIPLDYLPPQNQGPFEERPVQPDQIVLLTDGLCGSTCSMFVEMMTQAGARTVVAGGQPAKGPMQAASGTRGARSYDTYTLDNDIIFARGIDDTVETNVNATLPEIRDSAIYVNYASFNLRDQIRKIDTTPLQFEYEAADCRIYYTLANIYNITRLWYDVSAAAFTDSSLCVEGSTGFSKTNNTNPTPPPKPVAEKPVLSLNNNNTVHQAKWDDDDSDSLNAGVTAFGTRGTDPFPKCIKTTGGDGCFDAGSICRTIPVYCTKDKKSIKVKRCLPECRNQSGNKCHGSCQLDSPSGESKPIFANSAGYQHQERLSTGYCYPTVGTKALGCSANG